jgi:membrane protein DedA with SNARE-associated domain
LAGWIGHVIETTGVFGIAFLMFLENVFPPIPSELIMPLAGFAAARGEVSLVLVILAGSIGSLAGATFWYGIGRLFHHETTKRIADRHGRWLTVTRADLERADEWFDRHGHWAVLFGRLVPTIRTLISIPAGLSEMPLGRFLVYSAIGTLIWTTFLTLAGYWLGNSHERIDGWIDPLSTAVLAFIVLVYLWRLVRMRRAPRA